MIRKLLNLKLFIMTQQTELEQFRRQGAQANG